MKADGEFGAARVSHVDARRLRSLLARGRPGRQRVPGRAGRPRDRHAGAGRLRHERRRHRGGARRRSLPHRHRRRRRLRPRPPPPRGRPAAPAPLPRPAPRPRPDRGARSSRRRGGAPRAGSRRPAPRPRLGRAAPRRGDGTGRRVVGGARERPSRRRRAEEGPLDAPRGGLHARVGRDRCATCGRPTGSKERSTRRAATSSSSSTRSRGSRRPRRVAPVRRAGPPDRHAPLRRPRPEPPRVVLRHGFLRGAGHAGAPLAVTTRDMARLAGELLVTALGIPRLALVAGGSLGGMVTLEYCATFPKGARAAISFAAPASPTAWGAAWNHVHRTAIEAAPGSGPRPRADGRDAHLPDAGGDRAPLRRQAAPGRTPRPRLPRAPRREARPPLHHEELPDAPRRHRLAQRRPRPRQRLARARLLPGTSHGRRDPGRPPLPARGGAPLDARAGAAYRELGSRRGHDAFLLETERVGDLLAAELAPIVAPARRRIAGLRG